MTIQHRQSKGVLVTTVEGALDLEALTRAFESTVHAAAKDGNHLLVDLRGAKDGETLSYPDVYKVVRKLAKHPEIEHYCVALLDSYREAFEKAQFFEAVATDKGYEVRAFLDEEEAVQWLHSRVRC